VTLGKTKRHELHDKTAESPADNKNYDRNVFQETTENKRMFKILKTEFWNFTNSKTQFHNNLFLREHLQLF